MTNSTTAKVWDHKTNSFVPVTDTTQITTPKITPVATTTTYKPACLHDGDFPVWSETDDAGNKRQFFLADNIGCKKCQADVVLDLNHNFSTKVIETAPDKYLELNKYMTGPELIQFDWPDWKAIPATLDFWLKLLDLLPTSGRIMITCHGAHGRSGTCMAALLIARGMTAGQAIQYVRREHCHKSVEGKAQENYLFSLGIEAAKRGISPEPTVEESIKDVVPNAEADFCVWCGASFKTPGDIPICTNCWEDGYREDGQVEVDGPSKGTYIFHLYQPLGTYDETDDEYLSRFIA